MVDEIRAFTQLVKSVNLRSGIEKFRFILFPITDNEEVMVQQIQSTATVLKNMDVEWYMSSFEDSFPISKGT